MKRAPHAAVVGLFALATSLAIAGAPKGLKGVGPQLPPVDAAPDVDDAGQIGVRERFLQTFPTGGFVDLGPRIRRVWGTTFSRGRSPSESVTRFYRDWSKLWDVEFADLQPIGPFQDGSHLVSLVGIEGADGACVFTGAYFTQTVAGVPVFRSYGWGLVRNEEDFPMVLGGGTLRPVGDLAERLAGRDLNPANLDAGVYGREALGRFGGPPIVTSPRYVVWAGIDDDIQPARLAVEFVAEGAGNWDLGNRMKMLFVVDAEDGTVLHEESLILHAVITGNVSGQVTNGVGADACHPETLKGLPYARVTVGSSTFYADANGNYTSPDVSGSFSVQPSLAGKYFNIVNQSGATTTVAAQTVAAGGTANFTFNATPSELVTAQTNAYREANIVRDFALAVSPNYPTVSTQVNFAVNTNIASSCNAYYDGSSINFYQAGGGCNNTAFSGVVHHEYGHHLVNTGGSGQGAYGEGQSDVMAALILNDARLGVGFQTCTTGIRNADNTCQYSSTGCSSCGSAIHSCGQLISGCAWDLRDAFLAKYPTDYITRVAQLAVNSIPLHAGQTDIAQDITVDYLTLNDTDGNIGNGTPDYTEIAQAFGAHGLPAPALSLLNITFPSGTPSTANPSGTTPVTVQVAPLAGTPSGTVNLLVKAGAATTYTSYPMTAIGSNQYRANLPATACSTAMTWYVEATTTAAVAVRNPSNAPTTFFTSTSAYGVETPLVDDVETVKGWTLGVTGDTATAGIWTRGNPVGTTAQPENPRSGNNCFFTGQGTVGGGAGVADVDNGRTTLLSPVIDLNNAAAAVLSLYYWHSNDRGALPNEDPLLIQASSNGTTWVQLDSINTNNNAWALKEYRLDQFITLGPTVRVRVISLDEGAGGSLVESAIDDITVTAVDCSAPCPSDLDGNSTVDSGDIGVLLLAFGDCSGACPSDLDGNSTVDAGDIGVLLLAFGSCP
jgi:hypothetical protein